jgi:hypothetical protein
MSSDRPAGYGQVANARHRKLRKEAEKKGRTPSQNHPALCDWTLFVTNAPAEILPINIVHSFIASGGKSNKHRQV